LAARRPDRRFDAGRLCRAGRARLGQLASFISDTLLSGFKIGAALVIASTQLPKLFGLAAVGDDFFSRMINLALDLPAAHLPSLAIGVGRLLLALGERVLPDRPIALVVVLLSILLMALTGLSTAGVKTVGEIGGGLAVIDLARLAPADVRAVLPLAIACFLLAYVESFQQNALQRVRAGDEVEIAFDAIPGRVFAGKVTGIMDAVAQGQMQPTGELIDPETRQDPGRALARIQITDDLSEYQLPAGSSAQVAVYTEPWHHFAIIRRILLRMKIWMNYVFTEGHGGNRTTQRRW
jgi:hypothetical protein